MVVEYLRPSYNFNGQFHMYPLLMTACFDLLTKYGNRSILFKPASTGSIASILGLEFVFCMLVIRYLSFTDIDWFTYIAQAEQILAGERDYSKVAGPSGPLVYPAGHVYSILLLVSAFGRDVFIQQHVFTGIYIFSLWLIFLIYKRCKFPLWTLIACCLSRRLHSIYLLRMFNDCLCTLFVLGALLLFVSRKWRSACIIYSIGVSIKMNALLFAPGIFFVLSKELGFYRSCRTILVYCGLPQLFIGAPFLLKFPLQYISGAFDLSRVFIYEWTVNWRFLPESVFVSKSFGLILLGFTICYWGILYVKVWKYLDVKRAENIFFVLCTSNFLGIVFSRTLHFQFLSWYWMTVPGLLFCIRHCSVIKSKMGHLLFSGLIMLTIEIVEC